MSAVSWLLVADGTAFILIGIVVIALPSPKPALTRELDPAALGPFIDTRRLLASQFVGAGMLALLIGARVHDTATLQIAAMARIATLMIVIAINASQLRSGIWKRAPLLGLLIVFSVLCVGYAVLARSPR